MNSTLKAKYRPLRLYLKNNYHRLLSTVELKDKAEVLASNEPNLFYREIVHTADGEDPTKRARFYWKSGKEVTLIVIGAIVPREDGTRQSAKGNHFINTKEPKKTLYITDSSHIRDLFVLTEPNPAPSFIKTAFANSLQTLINLSATEATSTDLPLSKPLRYKIGSTDFTLIPIHTKDKYEVPGRAPPPKMQIRMKEPLNLDEDDDNDIDIVMTDATKPQATTDPPTTAVGKLSELSSLFDHCGTLFQHNKAKLVQLDIRNTHGNLIPPNGQYLQLRAGTVITAEVQLSAWDFTASSRRCFQLDAHSIRVWIESNDPIDCLPTRHDHPANPSPDPAPLFTPELLNEQEEFSPLTPSIPPSPSPSPANRSHPNDNNIEHIENTPFASTSTHPPQQLSSKKRRPTAAKPTHAKKPRLTEPPSDNTLSDIEANIEGKGKKKAD